MPSVKQMKRTKNFIMVDLIEKKKAGLMLTPEEEAEIEENMDLYEKMMGDRE